MIMLWSLVLNEKMMRLMQDRGVTNPWPLIGWWASPISTPIMDMLNFLVLNTIVRHIAMNLIRYKQISKSTKLMIHGQVQGWS
jgi:hypothetical protein